jgi:hypothetical protein
MSKPIISNFDFGQPAESSGSQNNKKVDLPPDNLILVDAYWEKDGMKIRFIPHQMGNKLLKDNDEYNNSISLIIVFVFKNDDDSKFNKKEAVFELFFRSDDTVFSQSQPIRITGSDVVENKLKDPFGQDVKYGKGTYKNHTCYYYIIKNFSSDLSAIV